MSLSNRGEENERNESIQGFTVQGERVRAADSYGRWYLRLSSDNGFIASFITTSTHVILRRRHNFSFAATPLQCATTPLR